MGGDPVPWKAPSFGKKRAYKDPRLREWQTKIATTADEFKPEEPYSKPVEIELWLVKFHKNPKFWGRWWDKRPDIDNLRKALADAIDGQALKGGKGKPPSPIGRVIVDDNQVVRVNDYKVYGPKSGIWVVVRELAEDKIELPKFFSN